MSSNMIRKAMLPTATFKNRPQVSWYPGTLRRGRPGWFVCSYLCVVNCKDVPGVRHGGCFVAETNVVWPPNNPSKTPRKQRQKGGTMLARKREARQR
jgi:hypothetical protein